MGKEVRMSGEDAVGGEDSVREWEIGLPSGDELTPLSQALVPSILAQAFSIVPERSRTIHDVNRASRDTLSALLLSNGSPGGANASSSNTAAAAEEEVEVEDRVESSSLGSDPKKQKNSDGGEAMEYSMAAEEGGSESTEEDPSGKTLKRPRLVWTPELHKRFVEVVAHLGVKNAVPKTIMHLMNVEGLTRENVASHLQKYRLYLKRVQGLTAEGPSSSDQLFSSTPVPPQSFQDGGSGKSPGNGGIPIPVPSMMPMPVYGHNMGMQGFHHSGNVRDPYHQYHHHGNGVFESNPYMMQQRKFGSMATSPSVGGGGVNDK